MLCSKDLWLLSSNCLGATCSDPSFLMDVVIDFPVSIVFALNKLSIPHHFEDKGK